MPKMNDQLFRSRRKISGFTMIELLITISIFALLTAGLLPFTLRYIAERQLVNTAEELYSALQLQQSNAALGVNGNWYGVEFDSIAHRATLFEVTSPHTCPITHSSSTLNSGSCTVEQRKFDSIFIDDHGFNTQLTYGNNPPEVNITQKIEARFHRSPHTQEVILYRDGTQQVSDLRRARITFEMGSQKRILVIDGGNICSEEVTQQTPSPCILASSAMGGPKVGRIFIVESTI